MTRFKHGRGRLFAANGNLEFEGNWRDDKKSQIWNYWRPNDLTILN